MNIALHHFDNNITSQDALQIQLLNECVRLGQFEGADASAQCAQIVNNNITKIYMDLTTTHSMLYTCIDLMICGPDATTIHFDSPTPPVN